VGFGSNEDDAVSTQVASAVGVVVLALLLALALYVLAYMM
jgi:hypothetical protein